MVKKKGQEKPRCDSDIWVCAGNEMLDKMKILVEREPDMKHDPPILPVSVNEVDKHGNTPLIYACRTGDLPAINYILDKGATTEAAGVGGMFPIHCTANMMKEVSWAAFVTSKIADVKQTTRMP